MKVKKEANWYDKVFKENLDAITLSLVKKVLGTFIAKQETSGSIRLCRLAGRLPIGLYRQRL